jgi:hypothetical protein
MCAGLLLLGLVTPRARAEEPGALPISFTNCGTLPEDEVRRIAGIELGSVPHPDARVEVQCGETLIEVRARQHARSVGKTMSVADEDDKSRARLIALSAAELVLEVERLSRAELEPPRAQPLPKVPGERAPDRVLPGFMLLAPLRGGLLAWGPALSFELRPGAQLGVVAALTAAQGERHISGGDLRFRTLQGELGLRALWPSDPRLPVRGFAQLSLLAGVQELRGAPSSSALHTGDSFRTTSLGARLSAGAELDFARHGVGMLELGITRYARTLKAKNEGASTTTIGPWFASLTAWLGVRW